MAGICLYEEVPRPYHRSSQLNWDLVQASEERERIKEETVDMLEALELILEPLESLLPYLQLAVFLFAP